MFGRRGAAPDNKGVCRFWKQGNCRFGKDCKYRHDDDSGRSSNSNANTSGGSNNAHNNFRNNSRPNKNNPYLLDKDAIKADLTPGEEKPQWPLSAYGPGRDAPLQLIEGPKFEVSPEELRVRCYLARATGQFEQYADEERRLSAEAVAEANRIVSQIDQAISYVQEGESREGNRLVQVTKGSGDFVKQSAGFVQPSQVAPPTGLSTFGHTSHANQNPAFPAQLGQQGAFAPPKQPSLGGAPSFGQPTPIGTAAFGQPSKSPSSFGQPSQQPPSFGQPSLSQPSKPKPSFGQSTFGQPSQAPSSFGQPSQAPSSFGQPSQASSPFGQTSQAASSFGKPPISSQGNAFGSSSQPQQQLSPFGGGGNQQQHQPPQKAGSGFGFGQPSAPVNGPANGQPQNRPFGGGFQQQQTQPPSQSPFGNASAAPPQQSQPTNSPPAPGAATNGAQPFDGPRGKPFRQDAEGNTVYQNPRTGNPEHVWFPNGHPGPEPSAEAPPETYEGPLGDALKSVYQAVWETGRFGDVVPEVPPKREWAEVEDDVDGEGKGEGWRKEKMEGTVGVMRVASKTTPAVKKEGEAHLKRELQVSASDLEHRGRKWKKWRNNRNRRERKAAEQIKREGELKPVSGKAALQKTQGRGKGGARHKELTDAQRLRRRERRKRYRRNLRQRRALERDLIAQGKPELRIMLQMKL